MYVYQVSSTSMSSTFMARTAGNNDTSIPMAFKVFIEDEPMVLLSPPSDRVIQVHKEAACTWFVV